MSRRLTVRLFVIGYQRDIFYQHVRG